MRASAACLVLLLLAAGCAQRGELSPPPSAAPPPPVTRDAIRFDTGFGPFTVLLYPEAAPKTVELMRAYVSEGYYVGREFNRVVPGHVIQVVDKAGGATDDARRVPLETTKEHHFSAGAAGIARGSEPNSGGPEIFFMDFATSHLDGNYTVWGQLIDGLDVVHKIARVPTVDFTKVPGASDFLTDRQAVQAVGITGARLIQVQLAGDAADDFPLQVAANQRVGAWRHSLEWPQDLRPGRLSELVWYLRTSDDSQPPPNAGELRIRIANESLPVEGNPEAGGAYRWRWAPPATGAFDAVLVRGPSPLATLQVRVGE